MKGRAIGLDESNAADQSVVKVRLMTLLPLSRELMDTYIDERGYLRFSNSGKLVHRWVIEKDLGRKLKPEKVVHHNDRNKLNNNIENLTVFPSQEEHELEHEEAGDFEAWGILTWKK